MTGTGALTAAAIVSTGLMAGLFFGWAVSVIPGTRRVDDAAYIQTMQQINAAIVNPGFVIPFIGTPIVLLAAAVAHRRAGNDRTAIWLATAAVIYIVGMLGVTVGGNIPLNNSLATFDLDGANAPEIAERRASYEGPWNRWHALRTAAVTLALGCSAIAVVGDSD